MNSTCQVARTLCATLMGVTGRRRFDVGAARLDGLCPRTNGADDWVIYPSYQSLSGEEIDAVIARLFARALGVGPRHNVAHSGYMPPSAACGAVTAGVECIRDRGECCRSRAPNAVDNRHDGRGKSVRLSATLPCDALISDDWLHGHLWGSDFADPITLDKDLLAHALPQLDSWPDWFII
jgi:hypothetical protein